MSGQLVDLGHVLEEGMPVYPGLPEPRFGAVVDHDASRSRYDGQAEFHLGRVEMPANLGTYLDAPFHRFRDGADLAALPLERLAGLPGVVVDAPARPGPVTIDPGEVALAGRALLVRTGWDARWGTEAYWEPGPYLSEESIDLVLGSGVRLVGVDFWNVDDPEDPSRLVHTSLLEDGILIVEHLRNLGALPRDGFRFYAVPPAVVRGASFPVRAFAELPE